MSATRRLDKGQSPSGYEPPSDPARIIGSTRRKVKPMTCTKCQHGRTKKCGYSGRNRIQRYRCPGAVVPEMWAAHRVILWLATGRATFCSSSELVSAQPPFLCTFYTSTNLATVEQRRVVPIILYSAVRPCTKASGAV